MIQLPENVDKIITILQEHGYEASVVGGCVRDSILNRVPGDWDITTSALPDQVKELFDHTIDTGIAHGTVTVMMGREGYEVTTYRIDGEYEDARHPKEVTFTASLEEDLKRRDFTINAMAYNPKQGLIDIFHGMEDLQNGMIRCVGNPMDRFTEDALRMLRAVRFSGQLGFEIHEETQNAICQLAPTISKVSAERIQVEMVKLMTSAHPDRIRSAYELGLTKVFLPEFDAMMETSQNTKHHCYTVGEHTIQSLLQVKQDKILRLTMLLHDIGKPACRITEDGVDHFYGHPEKSAEIADAIFRRLKFDNDTRIHVCRLIRFHDVRPNIDEKSVRKMIAKVEPAYFMELLEVKRADVMAQSLYQREEKLAQIQAYDLCYRKQLEDHCCLQRKDLAINGKDLMAHGIPQGKEIGEILERLFEEVLENPKLNEYHKLLERVNK